MIAVFRADPSPHIDKVQLGKIDVSHLRIDLGVQRPALSASQHIVKFVQRLNEQMRVLEDHRYGHGCRVPHGWQSR